MNDVKLPEPFWHAVVSELAPVINKAIRREDLAHEYAGKCYGQGYNGAEVLSLYTAAQMLAIHEQGRLAGLEDALDAIASNGCESAGDCVVVIRALSASDGGKG